MVQLQILRGSSHDMTSNPLEICSYLQLSELNVARLKVHFSLWRSLLKKSYQLQKAQELKEVVKRMHCDEA
jgi:hypothetical protein